MMNEEDSHHQGGGDPLEDDIQNDSIDTDAMEKARLRQDHPDHPVHSTDTANEPGSLEKPEDIQTSIPNPQQQQTSVNVKDWDGPDDPENPQNWSLLKKSYHLSMIGLLCFAATFGSSAYTPGYGQVEERFHVSEPAAFVPFSVYTLGMALGPVIAAPISEDHGRRVVYLATFPPMWLFILGSGFAQNFGTLVVCRFFAGMFAGPCLAVGPGSLTDMFLPLNRAAASSIFVLAPFLGPALGPTATGWATMNLGWRWTEWCIIFVSIPTYIYSLFQSETYKKTILQRRAKRLGVASPASPIGKGVLAKARFFLTVTVLRPIRMLFTELIVSALCTYVAFNFAVLYAFYAAFPLVFEETYGWNLGEIGLSYLGIGIGNIICVFLGITIDRLTYRKWTLIARAKGEMLPLTPEHRLPMAMVGSVFLPISLFWFAWTARPSIHWISPMIATAPYAIGNLLVFMGSSLYIIDAYGPMAGASAMAANGLLRYAAGAGFPLFIQQMYQKLGIGWATSLLGFISVGLLPIPWILLRYGPALRKRSPLIAQGSGSLPQPQGQTKKAEP